MSVRSNILANIVTTLQGITIAAGFSMDVGEVSAEEKMWADWAGNPDWPKICLFDGNEIGTPRIGCNIYDYHWLINIRLFHKGDDSRKVIDDLIADVKKAMLDAPSLYRGFFAWNTCFEGQSPVSDLFVDDRRECTTAITFKIEYREVYAS